MINPNRKIESKIDDCECCSRTAVELTLEYGNTWMCSDCKEKSVKAHSVNSVIAESRKIDSLIEVRQDVYNAATVPFIELKAAIDNDESIPADQKGYAFLKEVELRLEKFDKVTFDLKEALVNNQNERHSWAVSARDFIAKQRTELRNQFKQLDLNYQPKVKEIKPKPVPSGKSGKASTYNKKELHEAATKYGIDPTTIRIVMSSKNLSAENAAKEYLKAFPKK